MNNLGSLALSHQIDLDHKPTSDLALNLQFRTCLITSNLHVVHVLKILNFSSLPLFLKRALQ